MLFEEKSGCAWILIVGNTTLNRLISRYAKKERWNDFMNQQQQELLAKLAKDRAESADMLEKPSMRGIKKSVVEKYSDQAHFIYELLQNADDTKATKARFRLESDKLIFAHDGTRHFSISNPEQEDLDVKTGSLGDINAITAIANSNKTEVSIGKFGVGFKAVFQYTSTPEVYDPEFRFKIERFIVPVPITNDFPGRGEKETLFVFPFNQPEREPLEAYEDISIKLKNLSYPLLFLTNLREIEFQIGNNTGAYKKRTEQEFDFDGTIAQKIKLTRKFNETEENESVWLFSRQDDAKRWYCVGFFLDEAGHLKPVNIPAFCFFPTKESTGLKFILHAPFLLTDSREGIRAGVEHNDKMLHLLSILAADSFEYLRDIGIRTAVKLIDDNVVGILPFDKNAFSDPMDKSKVSFFPFYEEIKRTFEEAELLPTISGYVSKYNAYWASVPQLTQVFSNKQLAIITGNEKAQWVFASLSRDETQRNNNVLFNYINSLVRTFVNEDVILKGRYRSGVYAGYNKYDPDAIKGIDEEFIEKQPIEWLHVFYKWLSETKNRTELGIQRPIFLTEKHQAVKAFNDKGELNLFLPETNGIKMTGVAFILHELLGKQESRDFIEKAGIKKPSEKDLVYSQIFPKNSNGPLDEDVRFRAAFNYFCKCPNDEVDDYVEKIKGSLFLRYCENGTINWCKASQLYFPTEELKKYFAVKPTVRFVDLQGYKNDINAEQERFLPDFLKKLGVNEVPRIIEGYNNRNDLNKIVTEYCIEGLQELINEVEEKQNKELSRYLWKQLCSFLGQKILENVIKKTIKERHDARYKFKESEAPSTTLYDLMHRRWLVNLDGSFVSPEETAINKLPQEYYNTNSETGLRLVSILELPEKLEDEEQEDNLTETQKRKIALADKLQRFGIESEEDLAEFQEFRKRRAARKSAWNEWERDSNEDSLLNKTINNVARDIINKTARKAPVISESESEKWLEPEADSDELMPALVDYSKKIEQAKEKSAAELERIADWAEKQSVAAHLTQEAKYTVDWFNALLELESLNNETNNCNSREISISFGRVRLEQGTQRTLILEHPNKHIPQFMEELTDIPLVLHMGHQKKTLAIEVASVKSFALHTKLKKGADIDDIDLSTVTEATIQAQSPAFLLEELRKQFEGLGLPGEYNLQENLCSNIEFVFGPPGTGKTTHLAQKVLIPMMRENKASKVLVLTPTNKAADVLVKRIMELCDSPAEYEQWLIRFGATGDEAIEESPVFKDKTFDIRKLSKSITITTISRFPYDFFMPDSERLSLRGLNWDYIVIDEASMIPIANIVLPLYKKTPEKFIIAGDPFQIEPITTIDLWKNENIYTMVKLESFVTPQTIPHPYKVELLTTQYRSIPAIGEVFSNFAYGGILEHYRTKECRRKINAESDLELAAINIIKYPVSKYESIYRAKRLNQSSSYQIYSAIFTFEYVRYLAGAISKGNPEENFRIGIIAPYRAQADIIDKLVAAEVFPESIDVQVGTIHGFQGDECDIIFAVFNAPPKISKNKEMFLNKRNIINVSISRAREYLFIVMPDEETENIENLYQVKRVEQLVHNTKDWNLFYTPDLEEEMFGDSQYLEKNIFTTGHQSVNVYGKPERQYEIRTEENAVDIQISKYKK